MSRCYVCGQEEIHNVACGDAAREQLVQLRVLAVAAHMKGKNLQQIEELKLVGNAYIGMSERIMEVMGQ